MLDSTQSLGTKPKPRLVGIDGLRGVAAVAVVLFHVQRAFGLGTTNDPVLGSVPFLTHGVTLFFALSGFLLYLPFVRSLVSQADRPSLRVYLYGRILRVMPAYLLVLVVTSCVLREAWLPKRADGSGAHLGTLSWFDFVVDALLVQNFAPRSIRSGLEVAWTLGVEVCFYAVLPLLCAAVGHPVLRRLGAKRCLLVPGLFICVGLGGKVVLAAFEHGLTGGQRQALEWGQGWPAVFARSILVQGDLFGYGMLAAAATVMLGGRMRSRIYAAGRVALGGATAAVFAAGMTRHLGGQFAVSIIGIACSVLIGLIATTSQSAPLARLLETRMIRSAGEISFGIYLWHFPIIHWLFDRNLYFSDTAFGYVANVSLVLIPTLFLAVATHRLVELPAMKLKYVLIREVGSVPGTARVAKMPVVKLRLAGPIVDQLDRGSSRGMELNAEVPQTRLR